MQTLRQKAHVSLQEFREGKQSPLTSMLPYKPLEGTPEADEVDELSKLGGKTRLISQKDSKAGSPLLMTRSPNTQNQIVPLPLQPDSSTTIHPSVFDYLSTFPAPSQGSRHDGQYQDREMFAVPSDGLYRFEDDQQSFSSQQLPTPTSASSTNANSLVLPSPHPQPHAHQASQHQSHHGGGSGQPYFPQYFPVFDYGSSSAYASGPSIHASTPTSAAPLSAHPGGMSSMSYDHDHQMSYDGSAMHARANGIGSSMNGYVRDPREITPPEASMHNTWMDLVTQMSGMNG